MRCVIFDLDGTLADTSADLIDAANACFRTMGVGDQLVHGPDTMTALRGGRAMLRLGYSRIGRTWSDAEGDHWYPHLLEAYREGIDRHTRFFPHAMETVGALSDAGIRVGICTNKPEALARLLLTRLGVLGDFGALIGADTLPVRKPDPRALFAAIDQAGGARDRTILVGDTQTDHDTARAAGAASVLVTFGAEGDAVSRFSPEGLLADFRDLPQMVDSLLP